MSWAPAGVFLPYPVSSPPFDPDRWFADELQPHEPALRAWLRGRFPALTDLDDLVQETYVRVLQARTEHAIDSGRAFLFATARNLAFDRLRHERIVITESLTETTASHVQEERPSAADTAAHSQELDLLKQALQSLPDRCRQVLTLRKIYGLSQKEIAAQLGISENTVEVQVGNGMRRCAAFLARHGLP